MKHESEQAHRLSQNITSTHRYTRAPDHALASYFLRACSRHATWKRGSALSGGFACCDTPRVATDMLDAMLACGSRQELLLRIVASASQIVEEDS